MKTGISKKIFPINVILILYIMAFSLFIGERPLDFGTDTANYVSFYTDVLQGEGLGRSPFLFLTAKLTTFFSETYFLFLALVSCLSFIFSFIYFRVVASLNWKNSAKAYWLFVFLCLFFTVISPFFWNAQVNVLKAGLSIPLLLLGTVFLFQNRYIPFFLFSASAILSHTSTVFFLLFFLLVFIDRKKLIVLYLIAIMFYVSGISEYIVTGAIHLIKNDVNNLFTRELIAYYLKYFTMETTYKEGVRLDFLIFTVFFALVARYNAIPLKKGGSMLSDYIFRAYLILSLPFLFLGFIPYSDRLLLPAWFMIPLILSNLSISKIKVENYFLFLSSLLFFSAGFLALMLKGLI